jgi:hypothetical protein
MGSGDYVLPLLSRLRLRSNILLFQRNGYDLAFFTSKPLEISLSISPVTSSRSLYIQNIQRSVRIT